MTRPLHLFVWMAIVIGCVAAGPASSVDASAGQGTSTSSPDLSRDFLNRYCVTCHNAQRKATAGNLALDQIDLTNVEASAEVCERVIRKLRTESMPPLGMPRPDKATYAAMASKLET